MPFIREIILTTQTYPSQSVHELPPGVERRFSLRYPIVQRCFLRPQGANGLEDWRGIAYNISTEGVGVALQYQLLPGTVLLVMPAGRKNTPPVRAKVVHAKLVEFLWFHGCELLEPLKDADLQAWLNRP